MNGSPAQSLSHFKVFGTLAQRTGARLVRATDLGAGLAAAIWGRDGHEVIAYDAPGHHTVSLYLQGGDKSFRVGGPGFGGAGKFCVLPSEHYSLWNMNDQVHFLHLYIAPERLASEAVLRLDRDPRTLELRDRTYIDAPELAQACATLLTRHWDAPADRLAASSAAEDVLHQLLPHTARAAAPLRGGLAPAVRRRVRDHIEAHLAEPLTLDQLAGIAALSTYHFARMFAVSFGTTPHAWVHQRRLARARELLETGRAGDLESVAQSAGFGNASHLSRAFRLSLGVTPGQYRRLKTTG
ncbi:AraC family transcriptional regulator [Bordetella genomosp. 5]|uniref:AraC family transcriptional regulator n=1 Tax=Bordetella genomosp. 5 TaxID=1395608 RepID=A0A261TZM2_9BORD|nr:AraC family transcriptional regulator [Bordetella genomosp. 5]OZI55138.1 AraC family transcriptional regulator [Bordetella genomosp. 5]